MRQTICIAAWRAGPCRPKTNNQGTTVSQATLSASRPPQYLIGAPEDCNASPASARPKPRVRTFDVFDTLIARRCVDPGVVFDLVEQRIGRVGFAQARRQAEARVAAHEYTIDTIYEELGRALGLEAEALAEAKGAEIAIELEQVIPIAENLARVRHGDVLISDMYLGETNIRRLLDRAGMSAKTSLVVSSAGKSSGRIWPEVLDEIAIDEHLGDNAHSDNAVPQKFGIATRLTATHRPSAVEQALLACGLDGLAQLCRHTRLATWSSDADTRGLQVTQANLNFPLLLLGSVILARTMQTQHLSNAAFSSRDCDCWLPLFRRIARQMGCDIEASYYYTSRLAKMQPSPDYIAYSRSMIGRNAIVVDLCGSGWSLAHLAEVLDLRELPTFFLHKLPSIRTYEARSQSPDTCRFHTVITADVPGLSNTELEMANYADHPMVTDVRLVRGVAVPVFAGEPRSAATLHLVRAQQATFHAATALVDDYDLSSVYALDDESICTIAIALYQALSHQHDLRRIYGEGHAREDMDVLRRMGCDGY